MISPKEYSHKVISFFQASGNPGIAEGQMNYMRNKFELYGVKAPGWVKFSKEIMKSEGVFQNEKLKEFVRLCLKEEHWGIHYFGIQMVEKATKKEAEDFIDFLEELILTHRLVGFGGLDFENGGLAFYAISTANFWGDRTMDFS